ncbi:hypothetical protein [Clostridium oryzae]|uniref:MORN repeat variant n=1 Tax=Clostridium oryzae TaxID=1450648 RepID=A0A1V4IQ22_9CLOT|nr:hypothetical protein [Clostridium oryzae]OPJ61920.1 hypothetical protein CLORY_20120 [Clostridium oryzae]
MSNKIFHTLYGIIEQPLFFELYSSGKLKSCILNRMFQLSTDYGKFVPQYENAGIRRKNTCSLSFYENGMIKSVSLQTQTPVVTKYGVIPAEYITFYDTGEIKRIFPLNGKLSAYWDEDDEKELADDISFNLSCGSFNNKIIGFYFYKAGDIKSVTLWPKEKAKISTSQGILPVRIGFSLYENGSIKTLEPQLPIDIKTPIGVVKAFNNKVLGLNGDINSLSFYSDGRIKSLTSTSNIIIVLYKDKIMYQFMPELNPSILGEDELELSPLLIEFKDNKVIFNNDISMEIDKYSFTIERYTFSIKNSCKNCNSCNGCK